VLWGNINLSPLPRLPSFVETVSTPALHLSAEYLRLFATEALHRAAEAVDKEREEREGKGKGPDGPALLEVSRAKTRRGCLVCDGRMEADAGGALSCAGQASGEDSGRALARFLSVGSDWRR
jgi:hypothetical protein